MEKRNKEPNPASEGKEQDNIGYENTQKRADRDDREPGRLETTDTDNNDDDPRDVEFEEAIKD